MKTRYKFFIGIIVFIILFVLADKLIDRTPFVQGALDDMSQHAPYSIKLGQIKHSFLEPGLVKVDEFSYQDKFGNKLTIKSLNLAVEISELFSKTLRINIVSVADIKADLSEDGLNQLADSFATENESQTEKSSEALPLSIVKLDDFIFAPVTLNFKAKQGNIHVNNLKVEVSQVSLLKDGVFNLDDVQALVQLTTDHVQLLVEDTENQADKSKIGVDLKQTALTLDINQTQASQLTLQDFNLKQADIKVELGQIAEPEQNAIEQAGSEVKQVGQQAAQQLIELPLDIYLDKFSIDQINMSVVYQQQTYQLEKMQVGLSNWSITDNKQFVIEKLAGQLDVKANRFSQLVEKPSDSTEREINKDADSQLSEDESLPDKVTENKDEATAGSLLPFSGQTLVENFHLSLDINLSQSKQLTIQTLSLDQVDADLVIANLSKQNSGVRASESDLEPTPTADQQTAQNEDSSLAAIDLPFDVKFNQLILKQVNLALKQAENQISLNQLAFKIKDLQLTQNQKIYLDKVKAALELNINEFNIKGIQALDYQAADIALQADIANGLFAMNNLSLNTLGGKLDMSAQASYLAPFNISLQHFNADNITAKLSLAQPLDSENESSKDTEEAKPQEKNRSGADRVEEVKSLDVNNVQLNNVSLALAQPDTNKVWFNLDKLSLSLNKIALIQDHQILQFEQLSSGTELKFKLAKLSYLSSVIDAISLNLNTLDKGIAVTQSGFTLDKGQLIADASLIQADGKLKTKSDINWQDLNLDRIQAFVKELPVKPVGLISGKMSSEIDVLPEIKGIEDIDGMVKLDTSGFALEGIALDKLIDGFRDSQETSLLDVGAFMVTGPLGVVAMNFAQLGSGAAQLSGKTQIKQIKLDSQIGNSLVKVNSADIKTKGNHLGFYGQVDLAKNRFKKLKFGILDKEGCASIRQTLDGPFDEVKKLLFSTTTGAVTSPISSVFNQAANLANGGKCKPFFAPDSNSENSKPIESKPATQTQTQVNPDNKPQQ